MKKKLLLILLCSLPMAGLYDCSVFDNTGKYGYIMTSVRFPNGNFTIKQIPTDTNIISVEITGEGLPEPLKFNMTKEESSKIVNNIPIGNKKVTATSLDKDNKILAKGENTVDVKPNTFNMVEITLSTGSKSWKKKNAYY